MADNFNLRLDPRDALMGAGLDPNDPTNTYVNLGNVIAENMRKQQTHEQQVAEAVERIKQSRLSTSQKQEAADLGVNPELKDYLTVDEAVALLKANGVKDDAINSFVSSMGDKQVVSRQALQAVILKRGGSLGLTMTGLKRGPRVIGDDGKWYETYEKRTVNDKGLPEILKTDRFDEYNSPVFEKEDPEGYAVAKPQLSMDSPKLDISRMTGEARKTMAEQKVKQNKIQNWKQLKEATDPLTKAGQSALALAGRANQRADRAMALLAEPGQLTWQRVNAIKTDIAGIFQGGVPPIVSLSEQDLNTWRQDIAKLEEWFTGAQAEGLVPEDLQKQLYSLTKDIKEIDNEIIRKELDISALGFKTVIDENPSLWEEYKKSVLKTGESAAQAAAEKKLFGKAYETPSGAEAPAPSPAEPSSAAAPTTGVRKTSKGYTYSVEGK